ncbi:hypothetical protein [Rhodoferax bucti]|uniref:hypothetical protein n=1 Tax=Rhodoferax bucti TaxID=2576305 RepID=UPI001109AD34|nr:hypothetical protein [Rhodoferax bucti]
MNTKLNQIDARIEKLKAQRAAALARETQKEQKKFFREAIAIGTWLKNQHPDQWERILLTIKKQESSKKPPPI